MSSVVVHVECVLVECVHDECVHVECMHVECVHVECVHVKCVCMSSVRMLNVCMSNVCACQMCVHAECVHVECVQDVANFAKAQNIVLAEEAELGHGPHAERACLNKALPCGLFVFCRTKLSGNAVLILKLRTSSHNA